jgi:hypothetical protein
VSGNSCRFRFEVGKFDSCQRINGKRSEVLSGGLQVIVDLLDQCRDICEQPAVFLVGYFRTGVADFFNDFYCSNR